MKSKYILQLGIISICLLCSVGMAEAADRYWVASDVTSGLVGHWKMDETSGTTITDSAGSNNGTAQQDASGLTTSGKLGTALTFNGSSDYINISDSAELSPTSAITVSAWIKTGTAHTGIGVITKGALSTSDYDYMLYFTGSGANASFYIKDSGGTADNLSTAFTTNDNAWHHYVGVFDGDYLYLYIDGTEKNSKDTARTNIRDSANILKIGEGWNGYFTGTMDDVRIYNTALDSTDIATLYEGSSFNSTANWSTTSGGASGASVPGSADTAIFDGNSTGNCHIDGSYRVDNFNMASGFAGLITLDDNNTLTVDKNFTYTAGSFTANTGSKVIWRIDSSSTFSVNGLSFYNFTIHRYTNNDNSNYVSGTLTVTNDLELNCSYTSGRQYLLRDGAINVEGNVSIGGSYPSNVCNSSNYSTTDVVLTGTGSQTITGSSGRLPELVINKPSGTASLSSNLTCWKFTQTQGTFDIGANTFRIEKDFTYTAGTFTAGTNSTVIWRIYSASTFAADGLSFYNFTIHRYTSNDNSNYVSGTLTVTNDLELSCSYTSGRQYTLRNGAINVEGNVSIGGSYPSNVCSYIVYANTDIVLTGTGDQTITGSSGRLPELVINKPSGTASIATDLTCIKFTLTQGAFDIGANTFYVEKDFTYTAGTFTAATNSKVVWKIYGYSIFSANGLTFYDFTVQRYTSNDSANQISGTITVTNDLELNCNYGSYRSNSLRNGTINVEGNVSVGGTHPSDVCSDKNYSNCNITLTGTGDQTITAPSGRLPSLVINKTSGTVTTVGNLDCWYFTLTQGTFDIGANTFTVQKDFTYTAGTFTAATNSKVVWRIYSSSTFSANGLTFYDFEVRRVSSNDSANQISGTITVTNDLELNCSYGSYRSNGLRNGAINVQGNVSIGGTHPSDICSDKNYSNTDIVLTGTGDQTITGGSGRLPELVINKPSGKVTLLSNLTCWKFTQTQGDFDIGSNTFKVEKDFTYTAGTFTAGANSEVIWGIYGASTFSANGLTFYDFTIHRASSNENANYVSGTITVTNDLQLSCSYTAATRTYQLRNGVINVQGNISIGGTHPSDVCNSSSYCTTDIGLTGTGDQTVTGASGKLPELVINKPSGTVSLLSNITCWKFTQTQGTFDANDYAFSINKNTAINGGTFKTGTGVITIGDASDDSLTITGGTLEIESDATDTDLVVNANTRSNSGGAVEYNCATPVSTPIRSAIPLSTSLTLDSSGSTYTLQAAATLTGGLTITTGTTLDTSTNNYNLTIAGDFTNSGTFTGRQSTVTLNGTNQTITGANTFYALSKTTTSNCVLTLPAGVETVVQNSLTLQGQSSNFLYVLSSTPGTQTELTLQSGGGQSISYVGVKDNDASGGVELVNSGGYDFGNNLNWTFPELADVLDGIVGWWKLDETSGTLADSSGNGYHATAYNSPTYSQTGQKNTCLDFDGTNDYLAISNLNYSAQGAIPAMTVCAWIKIGSGQGDWSILDYDRSEYFNFATTTNGNASGGGGSVIFATADTAGTVHDQYTADNLVDDNNWHFVAATYDGTDKVIYVDAVVKSTAANAHSGSNLGSGDYTRYGFIGDGSEATTFNGSRNEIYFDGLIDDVRLYDRALSSSEISTVYSNTGGGTGVLTLKDASSSSATATNNTTVTAEFTTLESTVTQLELSNDNSSWTVVSGYSAGAATHSASWTMTDGDGDKIVYARITTGSTYSISDIIALDTVAPSAPTSLTLTANSNNDAITAQVTAPADADISQIAWRYNALDGNVTATYPSSSTTGTAFGTGLSSSVTASSTVQITASSLTQLKTYGVTAWAIDTAGNPSATAAQNSLYLTPPTPRLVVTGPSSATSAQSGADTTITITAKDENGNVISAYAGPYSLTWTPTGGSATTLVNSSSSGFSNGVVSPTVSVGGATAGVGTLTAIDNSDNSLTSGTLAFTFYPASFTITPEATTQRAGNPFTVAITAKDAADATCTNYSGTVALTVTYVTPTTGTKSMTPTSLIASNFTDGVASITNAKYSDCGVVKLKAQDTSYVTGVTITGTSSNMTFRPYDFTITTSTPPSSRGSYYIDEEFDVIVAATDRQGNTTKNYRGTVSFTQTSGLSLPTTNYKFLARDLGSHTFADITGSSSGSYSIACNDTTTTTITGTTTASIMSGRIIIPDKSGPVGTLTGTLYINNEDTNAIVATDDSCVITLIITEASDDGSATLSSSSVTVTDGEATFTITDSQAEIITVSATSSPSLPVTSATFSFGTISENSVRVQYWREITRNMPTFDTQGMRFLRTPKNLSFHNIGAGSQVMSDGLTGAHMPFHRAMMAGMEGMGLSAPNQEAQDAKEGFFKYYLKEGQRDRDAIPEGPAEGKDTAPEDSAGDDEEEEVEEE